MADKEKDKKPPVRKSKFKVKGEQAPQRKLEDSGDEVAGYFQGYKVNMLDDKDAPNGKKPVRFYEFRDEDGKRFVTSGRLMLDDAFDQTVEAAGGIDKVLGEWCIFRRLPDVKLGGKKRMGNYEIEVFETE